MKALNTALALFFLHTTSFAIVGEYLPTKDLLPQNCFLNGARKKQKCSSIVISKNLVLTAAHCSFRKATVMCPISQETNPQQQIHPHKNYRFYENPEEIAKYDLTLIKTKYNFKNTPGIEIAPSKEFAFELLKQSGACKIFGFGINNLFQLGVLHGAISPIYSKANDPFRTSTDTPEYIILKGVNAVRPGDSGGSLICAYKGKNFLVGISSRSDRLQTSYFATVYKAKVDQMIQQLERNQ